MGGERSPVYRHHNIYILPFERLVESFRRQNPPPVPQLAVPVSVAEQMFEKTFLSKTTPVQMVTGLLALIAFYYMIRVGECTLPVEHITTSTQTVQFTVTDVTFWKKGQMLTNWRLFYRSDEATLRLTNQKIG